MKIKEFGPPGWARPWRRFGFANGYLSCLRSFDKIIILRPNIYSLKQWRIQDFPENGANPKGGGERQLIIWPNVGRRPKFYYVHPSLLKVFYFIEQTCRSENRRHRAQSGSRWTQGPKLQRVRLILQEKMLNHINLSKDAPWRISNDTLATVKKKFLLVQK